jgi:hypothetical protein
MLTLALLAATAFAAGVTGAWSPCGFSMVETLGSAASRIGARAVRASCATFAVGALAGGALTFGSLAALGAVVGSGHGGAQVAVAVAIALLAALGEALGVRVVPQIRRQVPEPWRRVLPLPLAAGLYGVLLGLGFTTFVLTLAVWALAGIAVALGAPLAGLAIGLAFGAGRALPVVAMAPRYATLGTRLEARMAEQPRLLRRLRLADATLLAAAAVALVATGTASAATLGRAAPAASAAGGSLAPRVAAEPGASSAPLPEARPAAVLRIAAGAWDPAAAPGAFAWETTGGRAVLYDGGTRAVLRADALALGGSFRAVRAGAHVTVADRATGALVAQADLPGASALAVSKRWLVWRAPRPHGGDRLLAAPLPALRPVRVVAGGARRGSIDRPALDGDRLAFAVQTRRSSRIVTLNLATRRRSTPLRSTLVQLGQPALRGGRLLFVEASFCSQRLRIVALHGRRRRARTLLTIGSTARRDRGFEPGHTTQGSEPSRCPRGTPHRTGAVLWSTALSPGAAYVTLLRLGGATLARVPA